MNSSKFSAALDCVSKLPFFKAAEARALGISSRMLSHFCRTGMLERLGRGIYRHVDADSGIDFALEGLVLTALSIPHGVICLISALCYYELTDQMMREYWIAVPNKDKSPKRPHTRIVRSRNVTLGQITVAIGDYQVKIFDRERTIVDAFRCLSDEIAIKALQAYLKPSSTDKPDLIKLSAYAKTLKVNIAPYLLALI